MSEKAWTVRLQVRKLYEVVIYASTPEQVEKVIRDELQEKDCELIDDSLHVVSILPKEAK